jgi:hypothetical protein
MLARIRRQTMNAQRRRRSRSTTLLGPLLAVGLLAAACGGDDSDEETSGTTTTTTDEEATTTSPTTSNESTTSTVATKGDAEWVDVARSIYERNFAQLADPDPARVTDLYAETCPCLGPQQDTVEFLASRGEHIEGQAASVLFVQHEQTDATTGLVDLTVKIQANPLQRVRADGTVVEEFPTDDSSTCTSLSVRPDGPGGAYRVYSETALSGCPEGA